LKTDQVHGEDPCQKKMLAVPNHSQKANDWSCSLQQWYPRRHGCYCLSNSNRPAVLSRGGHASPGGVNKFPGGSEPLCTL